MTYLFESLLQCDTLRCDGVLRDSRGSSCGCVHSDSRVDDGAGGLEDLEVFDAAHAPFEMDHSGSHGCILCQK